MEEKTTIRNILLNLGLSVSKIAHVQLLNAEPAKTHFYLPHGRNNWHSFK